MRGLEQAKYQAKRSLKSRLGEKETLNPSIIAKGGNGAGTVAISGRPGWAYVRLHGDDNQLTEAKVGIPINITELDDAWVRVRRADARKASYYVIEEFITSDGGDPTPPMQEHALDPDSGPHTGPLSEDDVTFAGDGHDHSGGAQGNPIDHADLENVLADQHHEEFTSAQHDARDHSPVAPTIDVGELADADGRLLTGVQKTDLTDGGITALHQHAGGATASVLITLTNRTGGQRESGDVVVIDASHDESFTGTGEVGYVGKVLVVAETIADLTTGSCWERGGPFDVKVTGAVDRNDGLRTSATIYRAEAAPDLTSGGVFAIALTANISGDGTVKALFLDEVAGGGGGTGIFGIQWHVDGALAVATEVGEARISPGALTILGAYIYCKDPGTAGSTIVDINLNGVTIFINQANRPTLTWDDPDQVAASGTPDITALILGDLLTIDIDAAATGAVDLVVLLIVEGAGGAGGGGNGDGGAPLDAKYVVTEADADLTDEIVRPQFGYTHPDTPPLVPNDKDDEFAADALDPKWSWINQEGATIDLETWFGTLLMYAPAGAGDDLRIIEQTKPAGNFTMKAKVAIARRGANFSAVGIGMRDSSTGRIITLYWDFNSAVFTISGTGIHIESFVNFNTYQAHIGGTEFAGNYIYLKWQDDGTNFIWSFSPDGKCWQEITSQSRTAWLANPDRIFISWAVNNAGFPIQATCEWFRVTEP